MSDLEDILGGEKPQPEAVPEPQAETPEPEQQPEAEAATPETPEPQAEPEKSDDPKDIPYAVFKSQRDDFKNQIEDLKRQIAESQKPKPEPVKVPDMYEDPEGYVRFQQSQLERVRLSTIADMSEVMAVEKYGEDAVSAAFEAVKAAGEGARFLNSRNPYGDMVKWHKQQQVIQEIGDDPAAYREKLAAEIRAEIEADIVAKQAKALAEKAAPSMAKVNGSGGQRDAGWQGPTSLDKLIGP